MALGGDGEMFKESLKGRKESGDLNSFEGG